MYWYNLSDWLLTCLRVQCQYGCRYCMSSLPDFQKVDSSSHSGRYEPVLLWFSFATSSRYAITALDLAPRVVAILAGVGPLWQMVTIISHNGANAETRDELWSDGLLAPKANRTWSNVRLQPKCEGFFFFFFFGRGVAAHFAHQNKH